MASAEEIRRRALAFAAGQTVADPADAGRTFGERTRRTADIRQRIAGTSEALQARAAVRPNPVTRPSIIGDAYNARAAKAQALGVKPGTLGKIDPRIVAFQRQAEAGTTATIGAPVGTEQPVPVWERTWQALADKWHQAHQTGDPERMQGLALQRHTPANNPIDVVGNAFRRGYDGFNAGLLLQQGHYNEAATVLRRLDRYPRAAVTANNSFEAALAQDPVTTISELLVESTASQMPQMAATGLAGAVGGPIAAAAVTGLGSFATDYTFSLLDGLQQRGVDVKDGAALRQAFSDPQLMAQVRTGAVQHGVPVAVFDALSAGLAGRLWNRAGSSIISKVLAGAGETAMQGTLGAAGEAFGQVAQSGRVRDWSGVLAEAVAELPGGAVETIGNVTEGRRAQPNLQATIFTLADTLTQAEQAYAEWAAPATAEFGSDPKRWPKVLRRELARHQGDIAELQGMLEAVGEQINREEAANLPLVAQRLGIPADVPLPTLEALAQYVLAGGASLDEVQAAMEGMGGLRDLWSGPQSYEGILARAAGAAAPIPGPQAPADAPAALPVAQGPVEAPSAPLAGADGDAAPVASPAPAAPGAPPLERGTPIRYENAEGFGYSWNGNFIEERVDDAGNRLALIITDDGEAVWIHADRIKVDTSSLVEKKQLDRYRSYSGGKEWGAASPAPATPAGTREGSKTAGDANLTRQQLTTVATQDNVPISKWSVTDLQRVMTRLQEKHAALLGSTQAMDVAFVEADIARVAHELAQREAFPTPAPATPAAAAFDPTAYLQAVRAGKYTVADAEEFIQDSYGVDGVKAFRAALAREDGAASVPPKAATPKPAAPVTPPAPAKPTKPGKPAPADVRIAGTYDGVDRIGGDDFQTADGQKSTKRKYREDALAYLRAVGQQLGLTPHSRKDKNGVHFTAGGPAGSGEASLHLKTADGRYVYVQISDAPIPGVKASPAGLVMLYRVSGEPYAVHSPNRWVDWDTSAGELVKKIQAEIGAKAPSVPSVQPVTVPSPKAEPANTPATPPAGVLEFDEQFVASAVDRETSRYLPYTVLDEEAVAALHGRAQTYLDDSNKFYKQGMLKQSIAYADIADGILKFITAKGTVFAQPPSVPTGLEMQDDDLAELTRLLAEEAGVDVPQAPAAAPEPAPTGKRAPKPAKATPAPAGDAAPMTDTDLEGKRVWVLRDDGTTSLGTIWKGNLEGQSQIQLPGNKRGGMMFVDTRDLKAVPDDVSLVEQTLSPDLQARENRENRERAEREYPMGSVVRFTSVNNTVQEGRVIGYNLQGNIEVVFDKPAGAYQRTRFIPAPMLEMVRKSDAAPVAKTPYLQWEEMLGRHIDGSTILFVRDGAMYKTYGPQARKAAAALGTTPGQETNEGYKTSVFVQDPATVDTWAQTIANDLFRVILSDQPGKVYEEQKPAWYKVEALNAIRELGRTKYARPGGTMFHAYPNGYVVFGDEAVTLGDENGVDVTDMPLEEGDVFNEPVPVAFIPQAQAVEVMGFWHDKGATVYTEVAGKIERFTPPETIAEREADRLQAVRTPNAHAAQVTVDRLHEAGYETRDLEGLVIDLRQSPSRPAFNRVWDTLLEAIAALPRQYPTTAENPAQLRLPEGQAAPAAPAKKFMQIVDESEEAALLQEAQRLFTRLSANPMFDPAAYRVAFKLGAIYLQRGVNVFAAFTETMVEKVGETIRPYVRSVWRALQQWPQGERFNDEIMLRLTRVMAQDYIAGTVEYPALLAKMHATFPAPLWPTLDRYAESVYAALETWPEVGRGIMGEEDTNNVTTQGATGEGAADAVRPHRPQQPAGQSPANGGTTPPQGEAAPVLPGDAGRGEGPGTVDAPGRDPAGDGGRVRDDGVPGAAQRGDEPGVGRQPGEQPGDTGAPLGVVPDPVGHARADYTITDADQIGAGSQDAKIKDNIAVLTLLKLLRDEKRLATPDEQAVLVKYHGWGFSGNMLHPDNKWRPYYRTLQELLTEKEFQSIQRSTLNAHYTTPAIIRGMWAVARRLGFTGGRVLEPSAGIGHFFGAMPTALRAESQLDAVELDTLSAEIIGHLYQSASVQATGFQSAALPAQGFDLVVSNVPFGDLPIKDTPFVAKTGNPNLVSRIHNYFFVKSLDKVRPGGLVMFITSHGTLDASDSVGQEVRAYLTEQAELVGAIRLPNTAFMGNANTAVVTDIIILQKKGPGVRASGETFTELQPVPAQLPVRKDDTDDNGTVKVRMSEALINEYFVRHPEMVLGSHSLQGKMYGRPDSERGQYTLFPRAEGTLEAQIADAAAMLPVNVLQPYTGPPVEAAPEYPVAPERMAEGTYMVDAAGALVRVIDGVLQPATVSKPTEAFLRASLKVRDALMALTDAEIADADAATQERLRTALNKAYKAFTKTYGNFHNPQLAIAGGQRTRSLSFSRDVADDPLYLRLLALEKYDYDDKRVTGLSDIFQKRVNFPDQEPVTASTPKDALVVSLNRRGKLDMAYMQELLQMPIEEIAADLIAQDLIFQEPSGVYVSAEEYGAGNTRRKLAEARAAVETDDAYQRNVTFLEAHQPVDIAPGAIIVKPGAGWVPGEIYGDFLASLGMKGVTVSYVPATASWNLSYDAMAAREHANVTQWASGSTSDSLTGLDIFEHVLRGKEPVVYNREQDINGKTIKVRNEEESQLAKRKYQEMYDAWDAWFWADAERAQAMARLYNDVINTYLERVYDGSHLKLPGSTISLYAHQRNAVWRILQAPTVLLAHDVGTGKTYTMIGGVMELRRTGLARKPMMVMPKAVIPQTAQAFQTMYPNAKILVATDEVFKDARRRAEFMARIPVGDWDAVLVTREQFAAMPVTHATAQRFIQEQIDELREHLYGEEDENSFTVKQIEAAIARLEAKISAAADRQADKSDHTLFFEELGIDYLFVDEAHEYKNLTTATSIAGAAPGQSDRADDMYLKSRYIMQRNRGRGLVFATGTPIANAIAELHVLMRYLMPQVLEEQGTRHFDAWAHTYAQTVTNLEQTVTGSFAEKERLSKFHNLPELGKQYRQFADVIYRDMVKEVSLPDIIDEDGAVTGQPIIVEVAPHQALIDYYKYLVERAKQVPPRPKKGDDTYPAITSDARSATVDLRLILPKAKDVAGSKTQAVVAKMHAIWADPEIAADRRAQILFVDHGTPGGNSKGGFDLYADIKKKLVAKGIPENEIAFIHDAKSDEERASLYARVRAGQVRILIGSTIMMGVGVNIQTRLCAAHHMESAWRPCDIEQRDGRIIRQGNEFRAKGVRIYHYVVKDSFDAFMWNKVLMKAEFIRQLQTADESVREMEEINEGNVFTFAQLNAAASGKPEVKQFLETQNKVRALEALVRAGQQAKSNLWSDIAALRDHKIPGLERTLRGDEAAIREYEKQVGGDFRMEVLGTTYTDEEQGAKALQAALLRAAVHYLDTDIQDMQEAVTLAATAKEGDAKKTYEMKIDRLAYTVDQLQPIITEAAKALGMTLDEVRALPYDAASALVGTLYGFKVIVATKYYRNGDSPLEFGFILRHGDTVLQANRALTAMTKDNSWIATMTNLQRRFATLQGLRDEHAAEIDALRARVPLMEAEATKETTYDVDLAAMKAKLADLRALVGDLTASSYFGQSYDADPTGAAAQAEGEIAAAGQTPLTPYRAEMPKQASPPTWFRDKVWGWYLMRGAEDGWMTDGTSVLSTVDPINPKILAKLRGAINPDRWSDNKLTAEELQQQIVKWTSDLREARIIGVMRAGEDEDAQQYVVVAADGGDTVRVQKIERFWLQDRIRSYDQVMLNTDGSIVFLQQGEMVGILGSRPPEVIRDLDIPQGMVTMAWDTAPSKPVASEAVASEAVEADRGSTELPPAPSGPVAPLSRNQLRKVSRIVAAIDKDLVPVRGRKHVRMGKRRGFYKVQSEVVRTAKTNDLPTIAHEIGHHLHKLLFPTPRTPNGGLSSYAIPRAYWKELSPLAYEGADKKVVEGYAEFMRQYLIEPAGVAAKSAPGFYAEFERRLAQFPDAQRVIQQARADIQAFLAQSPQQQIRSTLVSSTDRPTLPTPREIGEAAVRLGEQGYTELYDDLFPVFKAVREITDGLPTPETEADPYSLYRLARGTGAAAESWIFDGVTDANGEKIGPSLREVLEPVAKELDAFEEYAVAKRGLDAIDLLGADAMPLPRDRYQATVEAAPAHYEAALRELMRFQDAIQQLYVRSGLLDPAAVAAARARWPWYVPLYRDVRDKGPAGAGAGGKKKPMYRFVGSGRDIISPLDSIITNVFVAHALAARNEADLALADLAQRHEGAGAWVEKVTAPMELRTVTLEQLLTSEEKFALEFFSGIDLDTEAARKAFFPKMSVPKGDSIIRVFRGGKPEYYWVHPELYAALEGSNALEHHWLVRILAVPAGVLRAGAVLTPEFSIFRNPFRDQAEAVMNSDKWLSPLDFIMGAYHVMTKSPQYLQRRALGGAHSAMVTVDQNYLRHAQRQLREVTTWQKIAEPFLHPIDALRQLSELFEETTRTAEYVAQTEGTVLERLWARGSRPKGNRQTRRQAALASREITVDFGRRGHTGKAVNQVKAFFNAAVQGTNRTYRAFKANPTRYLLRGLLYLTLPTLALWLKNKDDEDYQKLPEWRKDFFWNIPITLNGQRYFVPIPIPHIAGVLFKVLPERMLRAVGSQDKHAFDYLGQTAAKASLPFTGLLDAFPTAAEPLVRAIANQSFTGAPIVPEREKRLPAELQIGPQTSATAQAVGRMFNLSPRKVDSILFGYTGGLGRHATKFLADPLVQAAGGARVPAQPERDVSDYPVLRAVLLNPRQTNSVYIDRFYSRLEKLEAAVDLAEAGRRAPLSDTEQAQLTDARAVGRQLGALRSTARAVRESPTRDGLVTAKDNAEWEGLVTLPELRPTIPFQKQKRAMLDALTDAEDTLAREALQRIE